jgi:hypothetical protein
MYRFVIKICDLYETFLDVYLTKHREELFMYANISLCFLTLFIIVTKECD